MSGAVWIPAYIGIGSNLHDPLRNVREAFGALAGINGVRLVSQSRIYRTAPLGPVDQPHFFNAVAGVLTPLPPLELLRSLKDLETQLGRDVPIVRWGPRRIDFDLLVYGNVALASEQLTLPHAGLLTRAFALVPLSDVAPDLVIPGAGRAAELASRIDTRDIEVVSSESDA